MKLYPIMVDSREVDELRKAGWPIAVPYALVVEHDQWCRANHAQSADHLAGRGGLGVGELAAALTMQPLRWLRSPEASPAECVRIIREKVDSFNAREAITLRAENERLRARLKFVHELLTEIEFGGPYKDGCNFCGATEAPHATNCALDYYDHIDDGEDARGALKGG